MIENENYNTGIVLRGGVSVEERTKEIEGDAIVTIAKLNAEDQVKDAIIAIAMKKLNASHFIRFGEDNENCSISKAGATALISGMHISTRVLRSWKEPGEDSQGKYIICYVEMEGFQKNFDMTITEVGKCSTREPFHGKKTITENGQRKSIFKDLSEIDMVDIEQHAASMAMKQLVKKFIGRDTFAASELEKLHGITGVKAVGFKSNTEKPYQNNGQSNASVGDLEKEMVTYFDGDVTSAEDLLKTFKVKKKDGAVYNVKTFEEMKRYKTGYQLAPQWAEWLKANPKKSGSTSTGTQSTYNPGKLEKAMATYYGNLQTALTELLIISDGKCQNFQQLLNEPVWEQQLLDSFAEYVA